MYFANAQCYIFIAYYISLIVMVEVLHFYFLETTIMFMVIFLMHND